MSDLGASVFFGGSWYAYGACTVNPVSQAHFEMLADNGQWSGGYVEGWGYVEAETTIYGVSGTRTTTHSGGTQTITTYYPSSSEFIGERGEQEWYNKVAGILINLIPGLNIVSKSVTNRIEEETKNIAAELIERSHSGAITVEMYNGNSASDLLPTYKVYDNSRNLLYESK
ncbi:hypothetical protein D0T60_10905 [Bacteroides sp. 224]|nr:hypothetical protein [Bacteroides sp. 224]